MIILLSRDRCDYLTFDPSGTQLACVEELVDGTTVLRGWDVSSRDITFTHPCPGGCTSNVAFSPCGYDLVVGGSENHCLIVEAEHGTTFRSLAPDRGQFPDFSLLPLSVDWSPNGLRIAAGSGSGQTGAWDTSTGQQLLLLGRQAASVTQVRFSPDGSLLGTAAGDGSIRLWDVATGKEILTLKTSGQFTCFSFHPNGRSLMSGGDDGILHWWDLSTGREQLVIETSPVNGIAFTPEGNRVVTACPDETVKVWDLEQQQLEHEHRLGIQYVLDVAISPDGCWCAAGGSGGIALFDLEPQGIVPWAQAQHA